MGVFRFPSDNLTQALRQSLGYGSVFTEQGCRHLERSALRSIKRKVYTVKEEDYINELEEIWHLYQHLRKEEQ